MNNRVDSLLQTFIGELGIEDGVKLAGIKKNWCNLFNEPLSSHMSPCAFSGGELLINVDSPVWLQEFHYYKGNIIEKLSPYGVRDVRFRLGRVSTRSEVRSQKSEVRSLTAEELSCIENVVSPISDNELKETVRRAMKKALIAKRTKK